MDTPNYYERNLDAMVAMLDRHPDTPEGRTVGLELERILTDAAGNRVFFSGEKGVGAVIASMCELDADAERVTIDGTLLGLSYVAEVCGERVGCNVSLEPGAQIELSCGPTRTGEALYAALTDFDRRVREACLAIGLDAHLVARGYDPGARRPEDVELIPKRRYHIMDAYLPGRGSHARDMMRCSCSTQVSVDYLDADDAARMARRASALGPLWAFLFDNSPVFRGKPSRGMARAQIWDDLDPERCGQVPHAMEKGFSLRTFCEWISTVRPILMTDADRRTYPTGDATAADVMATRPLADDELLHLISMTWPSFRLKGFVELREMDSLPPRMAVACASLASSLMYDDSLEDDLLGSVGVDLGSLTADDVTDARHDLRERGWDARPYGVSAERWAQALADVAQTHASSDFDRESCRMLGGLWSTRTLPRDLEQGVDLA